MNIYVEDCIITLTKIGMLVHSVASFPGMRILNCMRVKTTSMLALFYCFLILTRNDLKCCSKFFFVMKDSKLEPNCPYRGALSRQQELKVRNKYQWITKKLMICDFCFWEKLRRSDTCIWSLQMFPHTSLTFLEGLAVIMIPCPTCWKVQMLEKVTLPWGLWT